MDRPHAAVPRHGLSAGAGLRVGRPRASRPAPTLGHRGRRARVRARRALLRRGARPVRRRRLARWSSPASRVVPVADALGEQAVLLALAATAYHAVAGGGKRDRSCRPT
ncbi:MAG: hypothetical protein MZW92_04810 [Comamonadaceae bacterium]|nr:hypothetical protein [Comamonadaceae bacterium]